MGIVSGGQQRDSTILIHVSILPQAPLPSGLSGITFDELKLRQEYKKWQMTWTFARLLFSFLITLIKYAGKQSFLWKPVSQGRQNCFCDPADFILTRGTHSKNGKLNWTNQELPETTWTSQKVVHTGFCQKQTENKPTGCGNLFVEQQEGNALSQTV